MCKQLFQFGYRKETKGQIRWETFHFCGTDPGWGSREKGWSMGKRQGRGGPRESRIGENGWWVLWDNRREHLKSLGEQLQDTGKGENKEGGKHLSTQGPSMRKGTRWKDREGCWRQKTRFETLEAAVCRKAEGTRDGMLGEKVSIRRSRGENEEGGWGSTDPRTGPWWEDLEKGGI